MESRKYQLQQQILEALKADDQELYALLKSQWAHRFGVESLEELNNLDLNKVIQNLPFGDNQKSDQSEDILFKRNEKISMKEDDNQEQQLKKNNQEEFNSVNLEDKISLKTTSYEIANNEKKEKKVISTSKEVNNPPKVKALIPIPPKPKYGYLNKWVFRNRF